MTPTETSKTKTAVVSGADAKSVADKLREQGYKIVVTADTVTELTEAAASLEAGSVDLYVQLPARIAAKGDTPVSVVRNFLADGLLRRFDAAAAMLPSLSGAGVVALVSGNHPGNSTAPDNPEARIALMKVLGHTMLLERNGAIAGQEQEQGAGIRVKVISGESDPDDLVSTIVAPQERPLRVFANMADQEPALDYAGWRDAMLTLTETNA